MRILGIDPGTTLIGFGLIEEKDNKLSAIDYGVLNLGRLELKFRLKKLAEVVEKILKKTKPDLVGLEKLFFAKNKKTALEVAQARGVIVLKTLEKNIPLLEFSPPAVKLSVTNYGGSDKWAVAKMVSKILNINELKVDDNTSDALAIAIAAANQNRSNSIE